ncbi:MAG: antitoxin [Brevundimonas sp.]|jgi:hypothetical protein
MSDPRQPRFEEAPAEFGADYDERSAAADADVAAGRVVPHERVAKWLQSIIEGKPEPAPFSRLALQRAATAPESAHD